MDNSMKSETNVSCGHCSCITPLSSCVLAGDQQFCSKDCSKKSQTMSHRKGHKLKHHGHHTKKASGFDWGSYLDSTMSNAVPISSFKHCCQSEVWSTLSAGLKLELPLKKSECSNEGTFYWIATVVKLAGYKAKLRYEGYGNDGSADFWVNICSADLHSIGWCASNGKKLSPPISISKRQTNWKEYLLKRITGSHTLPNDFYSQFVGSVGDGNFKKGMVLEVVDKMCIAAMKVASIIETVDKRLHLQYEGGTSVDSNDFWCHKDSPLIHPVGWSATVGHRIHASADYIASAREKAHSKLYDNNDCSPAIFTPPPTAKSGFKVGMKLESIDPLNLSTVCVATIMKVLHNDYLMIGIDGCMDVKHGNDWFCYHSSSSCILPLGFCEVHDIPLTPPKGYSGTFSWRDYLISTNSIAAPVELFNTALPHHNFREGLKLEAVDLMDPRLICVATVERVVGRLLKLHFDGWEETFDQWIDCDSPDIYPVGWCELMKYNIEGPKVTTQDGRPPKHKLS